VPPWPQHRTATAAECEEVRNSIFLVQRYKKHEKRRFITLTQSVVFVCALVALVGTVSGMSNGAGGMCNSEQLCVCCRVWPSAVDPANLPCCATAAGSVLYIHTVLLLLLLAIANAVFAAVAWLACRHEATLDEPNVCT